LFIAYNIKRAHQRETALIFGACVSGNECIEQMDGPSYEALLNRVDVNDYGDDSD